MTGRHLAVDPVLEGHPDGLETSGCWLSEQVFVRHRWHFQGAPLIGFFAPFGHAAPFVTHMVGAVSAVSRGYEEQADSLGCA